MILKLPSLCTPEIWIAEERPLDCTSQSCGEFDERPKKRLFHERLDETNSTSCLQTKM